MTAKKTTKPAKAGTKVSPKNTKVAKKPVKKTPPLKKVAVKKPVKTTKPVKKAPAKKIAVKKVAKPVAKKAAPKKVVAKTPAKTVAKKPVAPVKSAPKATKDKKEKAPKPEKVLSPKTLASKKKIAEPKVSKRDVPSPVIIKSARVEKPTHGALYVRSGRHFFTEDRSIVEMPELIAAQLDSYASFLDYGLQEALESVFPVTDFSEERVEIHFK
jgi:hypothetical protein